ncbi:hypothetical protein RB614_36175 [Phytohabitans sp. ZYX-F-186]|uniref:Uncharacterized protein n=1 Tax=Phytohabitans maris TaxID=3071409 RepID=A0ABU0ZSF1_9ACTN|nr:hypothetical protein [Phytohabitans sp. ZYX-F-186]MDQ7909949.1 hypothetical protein [Phytohabitans sp. ZYX-F-186]
MWVPCWTRRPPVEDLDDPGECRALRAQPGGEFGAGGSDRGQAGRDDEDGLDLILAGLGAEPARPGVD